MALRLVASTDQDARAFGLDVTGQEQRQARAEGAARRLARVVGGGHVRGQPLGHVVRHVLGAACEIAIVFSGQRMSGPLSNSPAAAHGLLLSALAAAIEWHVVATPTALRVEWYKVRPSTDFAFSFGLQDAPIALPTRSISARWYALS